MGKVLNIKNRSRITDPRILDLISECWDEVESLGFLIPSKLRFLQCRAARRAGLACYTDTTIVLSTFIYKESDDAIKTIIYHEIGHILAGPGTHHGPVWRRIVDKISKATGLTITRCYTNKDMPIHAEEKKKLYKFEFVCTGCGCHLHYMKATKFTKTYDEKIGDGYRWTCRGCGGHFVSVK